MQENLGNLRQGEKVILLIDDENHVILLPSLRR